MCIRDSYIIAGREPIAYAGINIVGLRRRGFSNELIENIHNTYRIIYQNGMNVTDALELSLIHILIKNTKSTLTTVPANEKQWYLPETDRQKYVPTISRKDVSPTTASTIPFTIWPPLWLSLIHILASLPGGFYTVYILNNAGAQTFVGTRCV